MDSAIYNNKEFADALISKIHRLSKIVKKQVNLMEVCGTHTMVIARNGLRKLLPENINLISGPGCPVCVTSNSYLDRAIALSNLPKTRIFTFGDMFRVPSSVSSLEKQRGLGASVDIVYSPLDAFEFAKAHPDETVIFLGVGFETTAPLVATVIKYAEMENVKNFLVLSGHKLIPPAMEALVSDSQHFIDGFICPGHVSVIIGAEPYRIFPEKYGIPCVITGFEVCDILEAIAYLLEMISGRKRKSVFIQYARCVKKNGNPIAQKTIYDVFDIIDSQWRGLGMLASSGLGIRDKYSDFDAGNISVNLIASREKRGCLCGKVLQGRALPFHCRFFGNRCNPEHPLGPCMVSSEGVCAAYYAYERR